jgi:hypothetical protein
VAAVLGLRGLETKKPKVPEPRGPEKGTKGGLSPPLNLSNLILLLLLLLLLLVGWD